MIFKINKCLHWLMALSFFLLLALWLFWPVLDNFTGKLWGSQNDALGGFWAFWWVKYSLLDLKQTPFVSDYLVYPFGINLWPILTNWNLFLGVLSTKFWGPIATHNLFTFISFPLTGLAGYFLTYHFTKKFWPSLLAGFIIAFCPYHVTQAKSFYHLAQLQWPLFYILFLFRFSGKRSRTNLIWLISFFILTAFTAQYYAIFNLLMTIIFLLVFYRRKIFNKKSIKLIIGILIVILAIFLVTKFSAKILNKSFSLDDLFRGSAHFWYLFTPAQDHPIFKIWTSKITGFSYSIQTIYLGIIPFFLAIFAICHQKIRQKYQFPVVFFAVLAIVSFLIMTPPTIALGTLKIKTFSYLLFSVFPFVRILTRFSFLTIISLAVLSAFSFEFLLEKIKSKSISIVFIILIFGLIFVEYLPNRSFVDLSKTPEVYSYLKNLPEDSVVYEYPIYPINPWIWSPQFYQTIHQKKLANNYFQNSYNNQIAADILGHAEDFRKDYAIDYLRLLGVNYIIVHTDDPDPIQKKYIRETVKIDQLEKDPRLEKIKSFDNAVLFKIKNPIPLIYIPDETVYLFDDLKGLENGIFDFDVRKRFVLPDNNPAIFFASQNNQGGELIAKMGLIKFRLNFSALDKKYLQDYNNGWQKGETNITGHPPALNQSLFEGAKENALDYQFEVPGNGNYQIFVNLLKDDGISKLNYQIKNNNKIYDGFIIKSGEPGEKWSMENVSLGNFSLAKGKVRLVLKNDFVSAADFPGQITTLTGEETEKLIKNGIESKKIAKLYLQNGRQSIVDFTISAELVNPRTLINPEVNINKISDNNYQFSIKKSESSFFLIISKPFTKGIKIYYNGKEVPRDKSYIVNGYGLAFELEGDGEGEVLLESK